MYAEDPRFALGGRLARRFGEKMGAGTPDEDCASPPEGTDAIPSEYSIQLSKTQLLNRALTSNCGERTSKAALRSIH